MPQSSMKSAFGWVGQAGGQDDLPADGEYNTNGMTYHKVLAGDFSLTDDQRPYEPEVGGSLISPGTYKSSYWSEGRLSLHPRLGVIATRTKAHSMVPLFWAFAGSAAHVAGSAGGTTVTTATIPTAVMGTHTKVHEITGMDDEDDSTIFFPGASGSVQFGADLGDGDDKWLTLRRLIPTATGYIGESFYNVKVAGLSLASGATGPIGMDLAFVGGAGNSDTYEQYVLEAFTGEPTGSNGWAYSTALSVDTIPMAGNGWVKLGASDSSEIRYVRDLRVNLGGLMTRPTDMTMVGQYAPGDYSMLSRDIGFSYTYLWDDADLYRKVRLGGVSGTHWSATPYTSPFFCRFASHDSNWAMGFIAQSADIMSRPVGVRAQNQVIMQVQGVVRDATGCKWAMWVAGPKADIANMATWPS